MNRLKSISAFCILLPFSITFQAMANDLGTVDDSIAMTTILAWGGWIMWILIGLSCITVFLAFYFFFTLRLTILLPKSFLSKAENAADNGDIEALDGLCRQDSAAGAKILRAATRILKYNNESDYMLICNAVEGEGSRYATGLWQQIRYLMDIATIAPLLGLLGTVLGMIRAFFRIMNDNATVKLIGLSEGVTQALVTTAGGLIVGILAMLLYVYFRGHLNHVITQIETQSSQIIETLLFKRKTREETKAPLSDKENDYD